MKKSLNFLLALALLSLTFCSVSAQNQTVVLKDGKILEGELFKKRYFFLPQFHEGVIKLKDGSTFRSLYNVNVMKQAIQAIIGGKDTITLSNEADIESAVIGRNIFWKIDGQYYHILTSDGNISLAMGKLLKLANEAKTGAYGASGENASITTVNMVTLSGKTFDVGTPTRYNFSYKESLYLVTSSFKLKQFNKKNLGDLYPKRRADIDEFIKANKLNLKLKEDALRLFNYTAGLNQSN